MSASDLAISVRGLGKSYVIQHNRDRATTLAEAVVAKVRSPFAGSPKETFWALRDVSFDVRRGEVIGVLGRNGAGKSTLLKILSRITEPTEGCVDLFGRVGSLLEVGSGFHTELTGRENVYLNGAILGMGRKEIDRQFEQIVDFSGVEQFLDTPVKRYSSGMYVRLAFAVAAHLQSEILLVDEVLAVGDAQFQAKCLGKMKDAATSGRTVVFVSHNMSAVAELCGSGIVLGQGQIIQRGDLRQCIEAYLGQGGIGEAKFESGPLRAVSVRQDGQQILLTATYEHASPMALPVFGFVISDAAGNPVCGANPRVDGVVAPGTPRRSGVVRCTLNQPRLVDGRYRLSVWFGDSHEDLVSHRDCLSFDVTAMAGARQLTPAVAGPVFPECVWAFDDAETRIEELHV